MTTTEAYIDSQHVEHRTAPETNRAKHEPFPPERLERRARHCGVIDEHGRPCQTWTLQSKCLKHRRHKAADGTPL